MMILYFNHVRFYQADMLSRDHIGLCTFVCLVYFTVCWIDQRTDFPFWYVCRMWIIEMFSRGKSNALAMFAWCLNNQHKLFYCWSLLSDSVLAIEGNCIVIKLAISSTSEREILKMSML